MTKDFIPTGWSAFAEWIENFATHLPALATKYGISATKVTQTTTDNAWVQYWVQAKFNAKLQEKQLNDFVDAVVNGELGKPNGDTPVWELPADPPTDVDTGIKKRVREIAAEIKAQKSIYTEADGELLGIVAPSEGDPVAETTAPELKLRTTPNYTIEIEFRRYGMDALRVETKQKAGNWTLAAILTTSPATINVVPLSPGDAEQIEVRAIFLQKNQIFGNYSNTYNAVIQP